MHIVCIDNLMKEIMFLFTFVMNAPKHVKKLYAQTIVSLDIMLI